MRHPFSLARLASLAGLAPFAGLALAIVVAAAPVYADTASAKAVVDAAKAQGEVGEQADGFLGLVHGGDPAAARAVAEINAGRTAAFQEAAAKAGTSTAAAASAAGLQLLGRVPPGQFYKPAGGDWRRK